MLDNTLDNLKENDELDHNEWKSCLFQIIMMLIAYRKSFALSHNDLHR